jgi:hypothetical protein
MCHQKQITKKNPSFLSCSFTHTITIIENEIFDSVENEISCNTFKICSRVESNCNSWIHILVHFLLSLCCSSLVPTTISSLVFFLRVWYFNWCIFYYFFAIALQYFVSTLVVFNRLIKLIL